ncbi:MAG: nitrogen regulation protein NR(I) [Thiothrix sp.]|nr:MAG: nitrogen regulation protein NR(I) [Thiothrix sp.]
MNYTNTLWIVDDDQSIRWVLKKALDKAGIAVRSFADAGSALKALEQTEPDALITDIRMPGMDGLALLERLRRLHPALPVIVITAHSDLDSAVSAYQGGAFEYLPKPFDIDDVVALARRACENHEVQSSNDALPILHEGMLGESRAMQEVFRVIGRLSHSNINVLVTGESGTGKELVARALHEHSPRAKQAFIALNTAAIPKDLLESELFGHEKGAFTGAHSLRRGRFEQADNGTLFLDEIGDMPAELQTRLLRVLSDGIFYRVGGHDPIQVDVRIIAATHQNLEKRVREGHFRDDLFHRLNVIRIKIPALRQRREDIPQLTQHFLKLAAQELDVEVKSIQADATHHLSNLEWPGNVRQLENACRWLTVMAAGHDILLDDLPPDLIEGGDETLPTEDQNWPDALKRWAEQQLLQGEKQLLDIVMPQFEETMIRTAIKHSGGRKQDAAKLLGWGRNTLTRKIKELGLTDLV